MNKKFSLLAVVGIIALVGAGCSSTNVDKTTQDTKDTKDNVEVSDVVNNDTGDKVEKVEVEPAFAVGDDVRVDLGYGWYEGKVEEFACDDGFYVRYKGLSAKCFTEDKLVKPVTPEVKDLEVGTKVIANIGKDEMFGGKTIYPYYSGEITAINGEIYTVKNNSTEYKLTIDKIYLK